MEDDRSKKPLSWIPWAVLLGGLVILALTSTITHTMTHVPPRARTTVVSAHPVPANIGKGSIALLNGISAAPRS